MSKFVIECPNCGKYAEAGNGFFARRKIQCACGYTINVRADKLTSRVCAHCGNTVVFDQSKGEKAKCPVCHEPINTLSDQSKTVEFTCAQCGVHLQASKAAAVYKCPVCDFENDVPERIKIEEIKRKGLASIIKYEGNNETLIWKHPIEDFNMGSQLIVHESQEAIFFRDGQALDRFGAGRYTLETQKLPLMEKLYKLPADTEEIFHSEIYFINLATQLGIKWGTDSKVRLFDPASGLHVELGASGEFSIRVINSRKLLLKVVGTTREFRQEQLLGSDKADPQASAYVGSRGFFRAMIMAQVKSFLAAAIRENAINILELDERLMELSEALREKINPRLAEYGLEMPEFYISRIVFPDDDPNFKRMRDQYAELYLRVRQEQILQKEAEAAFRRKEVETKTEARMKLIRAQSEAEAYKLQAEAEAVGMRMKGYTYQDETRRQVGLEAMKNGIAGEGGISGGIGDLAGVGVAVAAMEGVMNMTRDAIAPIIDSSERAGRHVSSPMPDFVWDCACGRTGISSKYCPDCGAESPEKKPIEVWNCVCGQANLTSNFCPSCGAKRPEPEKKDTWDCSVCGRKSIESKFCPNCGEPRDKSTEGGEGE